MSETRIPLPRGTTNGSVFLLVIAGCGLFVVFTAAAMLMYPGGTWLEPRKSGYSFFENLFSDLGFFRSHTGAPNTACFLLFFAAMVVAGASVILFFASFPGFFRHSRPGRQGAIAAAVSGVVAGACFVGIGMTPADQLPRVHLYFVTWAFRSLLLAAVSAAFAILRERWYGRRYGYGFLGFGVLILAYILLLRFGPDLRTHKGTVIHATGQKITVYGAILTMAIQAWGAQSAAYEIRESRLRRRL